MYGLRVIIILVKCDLSSFSWKIIFGVVVNKRKREIIRESNGKSV